MAQLGHLGPWASPTLTQPISMVSLTVAPLLKTHGNAETGDQGDFQDWQYGLVRRMPRILWAYAAYLPLCATQNTANGDTNTPSVCVLLPL